MKTLMVAHRGAVQVAPENTLTAFRLASKHGFKAVECDVQLSSDDVLFVIHDAYVDRTTNGNGWVSQLSSAQLKLLKIADNEHIPTLEEVIDEVILRCDMKLIIEIKADTELQANRVARYLATFLDRLSPKQLQRLKVHSFWYDALKVFKEKCPNIITAAVIYGGFSALETVRFAKRIHADGVSLGFEFVSKGMVSECHKNGLFVDTWTVSDSIVITRLRPFELQAIIEDFTGLPRL